MLYSVADIWIENHLPGQHNQKDHAGGEDSRVDPEGWKRRVKEEDKAVSKTERELRSYYQSNKSLLSNSELRSLQRYPSDWSEDFNKALRRGGAVSKEYERVARDLDSALSKIPTPVDLTLYRGVRDLPGSLVRRLHPGSIFSDSAFVSTSLTAAVGESYADTSGWSGGPQRLFRIHLPKGSRGVYLDAVVGHSEGELEFLLPRNTKFRVAKSTPGWRDYLGELTVVDVEVVK